MLTRLISNLCSNNIKTNYRLLGNKRIPLSQQINRLQSNKNTNENTKQSRNIRSTLYYVTAAGVLVAGFSYAAVPMYRMFCQVKFLVS